MLWLLHEAIAHILFTVSHHATHSLIRLLNLAVNMLSCLLLNLKFLKINAPIKLVVSTHHYLLKVDHFRFLIRPLKLIQVRIMMLLRSQQAFNIWSNDFLLLLSLSRLDVAYDITMQTSLSIPLILHHNYVVLVNHALISELKILCITAIDYILWMRHCGNAMSRVTSYSVEARLLIALIDTTSRQSSSLVCIAQGACRASLLRRKSVKLIRQRMVELDVLTSWLNDVLEWALIWRWKPVNCRVHVVVTMSVLPRQLLWSVRLRHGPLGRDGLVIELGTRSARQSGSSGSSIGLCLLDRCDIGASDLRCECARGESRWALQEIELISLRLHTLCTCWHWLPLGLLDQIEALLSVVTHIEVGCITFDKAFDLACARGFTEQSLIRQCLFVLSDDAEFRLLHFSPATLDTMDLALIG